LSDILLGGFLVDETMKCSEGREIMIGELLMVFVLFPMEPGSIFYIIYSGESKYN